MATGKKKLRKPLNLGREEKMSKLDEMREEKYWHIYLTALIGCGEAEGNPGLTPIMPA